jgi:hypothetical protein
MWRNDIGWLLRDTRASTAPTGHVRPVKWAGPCGFDRCCAAADDGPHIVWAVRLIRRAPKLCALLEGTGGWRERGAPDLRTSTPADRSIHSGDPALRHIRASAMVSPRRQVSIQMSSRLMAEKLPPAKPVAAGRFEFTGNGRLADRYSSAFL